MKFSVRAAGHRAENWAQNPHPPTQYETEILSSRQQSSPCEIQVPIAIETHPARWTALWPSLLETQPNEKNLQRDLCECRDESEIGSGGIQYLSNLTFVEPCNIVITEE